MGRVIEETDGPLGVGNPEVFLCLVFDVGVSSPVSDQLSFECSFPSSGECIARSLGVGRDQIRIPDYMENFIKRGDENFLFIRAIGPNRPEEV